MLSLFVASLFLQEYHFLTPLASMSYACSSRLFYLQNVFVLVFFSSPKDNKSSSTALPPDAPVRNSIDCPATKPQEAQHKDQQQPNCGPAVQAVSLALGFLLAFFLRMALQSHFLNIYSHTASGQAVHWWLVERPVFTS